MQWLFVCIKKFFVLNHIECNSIKYLDCYIYDMCTENYDLVLSLT